MKKSGIFKKYLLVRERMDEIYVHRFQSLNDIYTAFIRKYFAMPMIAIISFYPQITPNMLTGTYFVLTLIAALGLFLLTPSYLGLVWLAIFSQIGYIFDVGDGMLARYSGKDSPSGWFLDFFVDTLSVYLFIGVIGNYLAIKYHNDAYIWLSFFALFLYALRMIYCLLISIVEKERQKPESKKGLVQAPIARSSLKSKLVATYKKYYDKYQEIKDNILCLNMNLLLFALIGRIELFLYALALFNILGLLDSVLIYLFNNIIFIKREG